MKKKIIFKYAVFCFTLLLFMVPEVSANWEDYEVLKQNFEIESTPPRNQWFPWVEYNSTDDEFMVLWRSSGPLRDDCDPGDEYECTADFHSIDGRRVSTDGVPLGGSIQIAPPDEGYKNGPRFAYNMFTNEYMVVGPVADTPISFDVELMIARINNVGGIQYGLTPIYPGGGSEAMLPIVVFNPTRREYLVVYSDRNIFNAYLNTVGFILDENGTPIHGPFPVGNQLGDYYAPRAACNPTNNTYLVVWEDFRHVTDWLTEPCDVYGALLDAEGNMIVEIPVAVDPGMPGEGNQRVPLPIYNPDKNEFLVVYKDEDPLIGIVVEGWISGRIINADGTPKGPNFLIEDHPRIQHWPDVEYVEEEKKYFMVWNDFRNDGQPYATPFYLSPRMDVYARWLDDTGSPIGDEIIIAEAEEGTENWKFAPVIAYSPIKKCFLITWYDRLAIGPNTPFSDAPADIRGTLYGIPETTVQNPCLAREIYGEHSEEVELLRYTRDNILNRSSEGRELIKLYYQWSPVIVRAMEKDEGFKEGMKEMIDGILGLIGETE